MKICGIYFFGPWYWRIDRGIRIHLSKRWHLVIKLERWGKFGRDWFTDAKAAHDFGLFVVFDHGAQS